ncbi:hypothetical protein HK102_004415 [Quaeritorhiza haematococci]|nr:hypothetical protein HK102_004415 [Quaeritorhiza haematococci]
MKDVRAFIYKTNKDNEAQGKFPVIYGATMFESRKGGQIRKVMAGLTRRIRLNVNADTLCAETVVDEESDEDMICLEFAYTKIVMWSHKVLSKVTHLLFKDEIQLSFSFSETSNRDASTSVAAESAVQILVIVVRRTSGASVPEEVIRRVCRARGLEREQNRVSIPISESISVEKGVGNKIRKLKLDDKSCDVQENDEDEGNKLQTGEGSSRSSSPNVIQNVETKVKPSKKSLEDPTSDTVFRPKVTTKSNAKIAAATPPKTAKVLEELDETVWEPVARSNMVAKMKPPTPKAPLSGRKRRTTMEGDDDGDKSHPQKEDSPVIPPWSSKKKDKDVSDRLVPNSANRSSKTKEAATIPRRAKKNTIDETISMEVDQDDSRNATRSHGTPLSTKRTAKNVQPESDYGGKRKHDLRLPSPTWPENVEMEMDDDGFDQEGVGEPEIRRTATVASDVRKRLGKKAPTPKRRVSDTQADDLQSSHATEVRPKRVRTTATTVKANNTAVAQRKQTRQARVQKRDPTPPLSPESATGDENPFISGLMEIMNRATLMVSTKIRNGASGIQTSLNQTVESIDYTMLHVLQRSQRAVVSTVEDSSISWEFPDVSEWHQAAANLDEFF